MKKIWLIGCPFCKHEMEVDPITTPTYRAKACDKCGKDFEFLNSEVKIKEIPEN